VYYAFPVIIITVAYSVIFQRLSREVDVIGINNDATKRIMNMRKTTAKTMLLIAVIFIVFEGPYFITFLLICFGVKVQSNPLFLLLTIAGFAPHQFCPEPSCLLHQLWQCPERVCSLHEGHTGKGQQDITQEYIQVRPKYFRSSGFCQKPTHIQKWK
jgi:hypothetical protein